MTTPSRPSSSYAEGPGLPARSAQQVDPVEETPVTGGLVQLGAADGVVCEDGLCWVPAAES